MLPPGGQLNVCFFLSIVDVISAELWCKQNTGLCYHPFFSLHEFAQIPLFIYDCFSFNTFHCNIAIVSIKTLKSWIFFCGTNIVEWVYVYKYLFMVMYVWEGPIWFWFMPQHLLYMSWKIVYIGVLQGLSLSSVSLCLSLFSPLCFLFHPLSIGMLFFLY